MCCGGLNSGCGPNQFQPEFKRQWKPENNSGCCSNGSGRNDCDKSSLAVEGSPLANWESIYGRLITKITYEKNEITGHSIQKIEKVICPIEIPQKSRHGCCSFSYRLKR